MRTINFMGVRNIAFAVTVILTMLSMASLAFKGLNWGLDFTGGTQILLTFPNEPKLEDLRNNLDAAGYKGATVQSFGEANEISIRIQGDSPTLSQSMVNLLQTDTTNNPTVSLIEFVGPQVGEELRDQGGIAMLLALGGVLLYVAFRFQWKFAVGAVVSLIHDVIIAMGALSFFQITFDLTTLAAVLAIIGYSLNDTIVVFDRVRENFRLLRKGSLIDNLNISTTQTLLRTIATSVSTLLAVLALLFFGGESLFGFSITLICGIVAGTYSSVYIANTMLIWLNLTSDDLIAQNTPVDTTP